MCISDEPLTNHMIASLANGQIPLGKRHLSIASSKHDVLSQMGDKLAGMPREWAAQNSDWARYTFTTEILWYPRQNVSFTFREETLIVVDFHDPAEPDTDGDYSLETHKYLRMKEKLIEHLGKKTRYTESDPLNMEVVWDFPRLSICLSCDAKTGGCGLSLQPGYK